ncbi:dihydroorotate dehydrogenase-like protein [bacterium]|nr:dihydroorotate dehydrogenase-like protein [bacterium]
MDLSTKYMGIELKNPVVLGASPLSDQIDVLRAVEDNGAAAVVAHSIFEEQIRHEELEMIKHMERGADSFAEAITFFPEADDYLVTPDDYLENLRRAKDALDIPVFGSLNGVSVGGWIEYAKKIEETGVDGLELNIYHLPTETDLTPQTVEKRYLDVLDEVKRNVKIPVAMKLGPQFSSFANFAKRLEDEGVDGLVLFNRFYQPDFDLETMSVIPNLVLSNSHELRLPLRWIAILYTRIKVSMALTTGIHQSEDVIKAMMAGADCAQVVSAVLRNGPAVLGKLIAGMEEWMEENEYESVEQMKGALSQHSCPDPTAYERANYMKTLQSWS